MKIRILDADPEQAARSLIYPHIGVTIRALRFTFASCFDYTLYRKYKTRRIDAVRYSAENYIWFSEFYEALVSLCKRTLDNIQEFNESQLYNCSALKFQHHGLNLFPESKGTLTDLITASRVEYIKEGYSSMLFPAGVPGWYIDTNKIIYEKYDSTAGKSYRVTQSNKGLKYFTAEYFNQWNEITDVPKDIEELIRHLIYRK